jgi:NAD(P)-dependent dehydrogenase (short-subunit alcohol dehydrogenase family)
VYEAAGTTLASDRINDSLFKPAQQEEDIMAGKLAGKIALVTGASTGIGLATAKAFTDEGAFVFITGRRKQELEAAAQSLGTEVRAIQGDASDMASLDATFETIRSEKGRLDIIFANAGGGSLAPLGSITEEQYTSTFDRNVKGLVFTVQKALPLLASGSSVILNGSTTSIKGVAAFSIYAASKAAVRSFARSWTTDLKDKRIRVNAISPGATETPGLLGLAETDEQKRAMLQHFASEVPLGRVAQPEEIAKAVVFLASDDASYISGIELFVDGGAVQV